MPYEPQRFIHAANIRLDVLVSVHFSEQLTDELRHGLEDATLTAFECVVQQCVSRKVDFLLLSGNVFLEAERSLRARLTLLKGFELQLYTTSKNCVANEVIVDHRCLFVAHTAAVQVPPSIQSAAMANVTEYPHNLYLLQQISMSWIF